jgi:putative heme transporter
MPALCMGQAVEASDPAPQQPGPQKTARPGRRRVVKYGIVIAAVALEVALVAPRVAHDGRAFGDLHWGWAAAAVGAELVSVIALGVLYLPLLRSGGLRMSRSRAVGLGAAASAITVTVPGGVAVASAYLYRQFRRLGGTTALAGWAVAAAATLSVVAFSAVTGTGAVLGVGHSTGAAIQTGAVVAAGVVLIIALSTAVTKHPTPLLRAMRAVSRRIPGSEARKCRREASLERAVTQFAAIRPSWQQWTIAFALAALTWAGDLACFVLSMHAIGVGGLGLAAAAISYGAGMATTSVSLVPAGIGTVEAGMMLGLTHAGIAATAAVAGILVYRLVAYGLVAAGGWVVWATLRRGQQPATH